MKREILWCETPSSCSLHPESRGSAGSFTLEVKERSEFWSCHQLMLLNVVFIAGFLGLCFPTGSLMVFRQCLGRCCFPGNSESEPVDDTEPEGLSPALLSICQKDLAFACSHILNMQFFLIQFLQRKYSFFFFSSSSPKPSTKMVSKILSS